MRLGARIEIKATIMPRVNGISYQCQGHPSTARSYPEQMGRRQRGIEGGLMVSSTCTLPHVSRREVVAVGSPRGLLISISFSLTDHALRAQRGLDEISDCNSANISRL
jgi:hypothetical protein